MYVRPECHQVSGQLHHALPGGLVQWRGSLGVACRDVDALVEQEAGHRTVLVAEWKGTVAGYVTILWESGDPLFSSRGIPEINDFNVLSKCRRKGIGSALMDAAEAIVAKRSPVVGRGVGLHPGYGSAQRLYVRRGYVPDGAGVVVDGNAVPEGSEIRLDDRPMLRMTKELE